MPSGLTPVQTDTLKVLGAAAGERPTFPSTLRDDLVERLEDALAPAAAMMGGEQLVLSKHPIATVLACEAKHVAEASQPFAWSVPTARGTVAHKAVELSLHWPTAEPLDLVDEVIRRSAGDATSLGEFLESLDQYDLAELRSAVNDIVVKFVECFPPIKPAWRPTSESRLSVELLGGAVLILGRADLVLGRPAMSDKGDTVAGKVIIDYKTGSFSPSHVDDLRLYALVETIRLGVPPRRVASYYLDQARAFAEDVTIGVLEAASRRLIDAATKLAELRSHSRLAERTPNFTCRFCPLASPTGDAQACAPGQAWLAAREADE